jgi:predicted DsbA family dithiol-disulfide isomerase
MARSFFMGFVLGIFLPALSTNALEINALSDNERASFRAEVRSYLLENPEVLMEAIAVLQTLEAKNATQSVTQLLESNYDAIVNDPTSWQAHSEVAELIASDGNIRYIVKEYPILGPESELASRFAIATRLTEGDAAYKDVYNGLFVFKGEMTKENLVALAKQLGLDGEAIAAVLAEESVTDILSRSIGLGQTLGVNGTPTYIVNGQMLRGYVPLEDMRQMVAALRKG